jgi:hypothetical protein
LDFVESQGADVVVFTEWRRGDSLVEAWATSRGMHWIGACEGAPRNGAEAERGHLSVGRTLLNDRGEAFDEICRCAHIAISGTPASVRS